MEPSDPQTPPSESTRISAKSGWNRTKVNFWLDTALLLAFVSLCGVSVVIRFVFPKPTIAAGWRLWGGAYEQWADTQFILLAVLAFGVLIHVMLHWAWICGVIVNQILRTERRRAADDGVRTLYGVGLLIVLLNIVGAFIAAAALMIRGPG